MTRAGVFSGNLTAERVIAVVTLTLLLSVLCATSSPLLSALRQSQLPTGSQALSDRSRYGRLAWALDAEPRG